MKRRRSSKTATLSLTRPWPRPSVRYGRSGGTSIPVGARPLTWRSPHPRQSTILESPRSRPIPMDGERGCRRSRKKPLKILLAMRSMLRRNLQTEGRSMLRILNRRCRMTRATVRTSKLSIWSMPRRTSQLGGSLMMRNVRRRCRMTSSRAIFPSTTLPIRSMPRRNLRSGERWMPKTLKHR